VRKIVEAAGILILGTTLALTFYHIGLAETNIVLVYLLSVVLIALRSRTIISTCSSAVSVLLFNFFFTEPRFTFVVYDIQYIFTFLVMLIVSLITSTLTSRIRIQADMAIEHERMKQEHQAASMRAETEQNRTTILRSITHDLRTPLASISGASSTILDEYGSLDDKTKKELLTGIVEESAWLTGVVENLLILSHLQNSGTSIRKTKEVLDDVLFSAVQLARKRLGNRSLEVVNPEEIILIPMDGTLIEQALVNLIDNAGRHTGEHTHIRVTAGKSIDGKAVDFIVADNGPGIPEEVLKTIFIPFMHASREWTRSKGGVGLGLGICKAIAEIHGGSIKIENQISGGTSITLTLPLDKEGAYE
jgi:two-component system sensor histidine kinase KdpD